MKKLLLTMAILAFLTIPARAEIDLSDLSEKLPALESGIAWDFDQKGMTYTSTLTLLEWKGIKLDGGYAGTPDNKNEEQAHSLIAGLSYEITNLEKLGVTIPILKHIKLEPMVYCGWNSINSQEIGTSEFTYGAGIKIFEVSI